MFNVLRFVRVKRENYDSSNMARAISRLSSKSSDAKSPSVRSFRCCLSKSDLTSFSMSAWNVSKNVGAAHSVLLLAGLCSQSRSFSECCCCDFHFMILNCKFRFETRPLGGNGVRVSGQLPFISNHRRIARFSKLIPLRVIIGCSMTSFVIGHRKSSGTSAT